MRKLVPFGLRLIENATAAGAFSSPSRNCPYFGNDARLSCERAGGLLIPGPKVRGTAIVIDINNPNKK